MYSARAIEVPTRGRGLYDITRQVQDVVSKDASGDGLCTVFIHHTSASLIIGENADPSVLRDLEAFFSRLVPDGDPLFEHVAEGDDDMPSHVRSVLTATSISIPIRGHQLDLGTWQAIYLYEHRLAAHRRRVTISIVG